MLFLMKFSALWISILALLFCFAPCHAQEAAGTLRGTALDYSSHKPLAGVLIKVEGTSLATRADSSGKFIFRSISAGKYKLIGVLGNYYSTVSDPIEIYPEKTTSVQINMLSGEPAKFLYFSVGGITVTAERDLLPGSHENTFKISSSEIEHMQATNIGDVLDLIPGVDCANRPGLETPKKIGLRGADGLAYSPAQADQPEAFGTRLVVDNIPFSNNVNLNAGAGASYGEVKPTVGGGIDLRKLPADNVEAVEVIYGVPSVEYGDFVGGIVRVTTKSGDAPMRLKLKSNPDTKEFNLSDGFALGSGHTINYSINYAYGLRDIRFSGDEVKRLSFQAVFNHKVLSRLKMNETIRFSRWFDDYTVEGDSLARQAYNHDSDLSIGQKIDYRISKQTSLSFTGYLNYTNRKNYRRQKETVSNVYVTNRLTSGTQPAALLQQPYIWDMLTTGREYHAAGKVNLQHRLLTKGIIHNLLIGGEYQFEGNRGQGRQFDPLSPPFGKAGDRPHSFRDIPDFRQAGFYAEDRIAARLHFPMTFTLGLRGEMYNPTGFGGSELIRSRNGTYWNPRTGLRIRFHRDLQIRSSYGISSKAPPLLYLYPEPFYQDILEWHYGVSDTIPLMTTNIFNLENPGLKGYTQRKFEVAVDYQIQNIGLTLTAFRERVDNAPSLVSLPLMREVYAWPEWPSSQNKVLVKKDAVNNGAFARAENLAWVERRGMEFVLHSRRIDRLNMIFRINGAFSIRRNGRKSSLSVSGSKKITEIGTQGGHRDIDVYPVYPYFDGRSKKLIMKYNLDYVNKPLGIWLTFTFYHKILDESLTYDTNLKYKTASGYFKDGIYYPVSPEQASDLGLVSIFEANSTTTFRLPVTYFFNITVSKGIYEGMELSLFVNNVLNERNFYYNNSEISVAANPEIFFGIEFSAKVQPLAKSAFSSLFK